MGVLILTGGLENGRIFAAEGTNLLEGVRKHLVSLSYPRDDRLVEAD